MHVRDHAAMQPEKRAIEGQGRPSLIDKAALIWDLDQNHHLSSGREHSAFVDIHTTSRLWQISWNLSLLWMEDLSGKAVDACMMDLAM